MKFKLTEDYISSHRDENGIIEIDGADLTQKDIEEFNKLDDEYVLVDDIPYCDDDNWWEDNLSDQELMKFYGFKHKKGWYYIPEESTVKFIGIGPSGWPEFIFNNAEESIDIAGDPFRVIPMTSYEKNNKQVPFDTDIMYESLNEGLQEFTVNLYDIEWDIDDRLKTSLPNEFKNMIITYDPNSRFGRDDAISELLATLEDEYGYEIISYSESDDSEKQVKFDADIMEEKWNLH